MKELEEGNEYDQNTMYESIKELTKYLKEELDKRRYHFSAIRKMS